MSLNQFFNENLLRVFKEIKNPTKEDFYVFLANLRESSDIYLINSQILERASAEDAKELDSLNTTRAKHYKNRQIIEKQGCYSKTHFDALSEYRQCSKFLAGHHRIFDLAEISFGKAFGINYEYLAEEYARELEKELEEQAKQKALEEEIKRESRRRNELVNRNVNLSGAGDALSMFFGFLAEITTHLIRKR